jgi:hypothetical protein
LAAHVGIDVTKVQDFFPHPEEDVCPIFFKKAEDAAEFKKSFLEKEFDGKKGSVLETEKLKEWLRVLLVERSQVVQMIDNELENIFSNLCYKIISSKKELFRDQVTAMKEQSLKEDLIDLHKIRERVSALLNEKQDNLELILTKETVLPNNENPPLPGVTHLQYLKASDNMLVIQNDAMKLLRREVAGDFPLDSKVFNNNPSKPSDRVTISLELQSLSMLINNLNWEQCIREKFCDEPAIEEFFEAVERALKQNLFSRSRVLLTFEFSLVKGIIDALLNYTVSTLNKYRSLYGIEQIQDVEIKAQAGSTAVNPPGKESEFNKEFDQELPFFEKDEKKNSEQIEIVSKKPEEQPEKKQDADADASGSLAFPLESVYCNLGTLLRVDEQLLAMTQHEGAEPELLGLFFSKTSRLYSAFSRLSSFLNFPENQKKFSLIDLAEAGLYNYSDYMYELRHFIDPTTPLESIINDNSSTDIWGTLKQQLPFNRMLNGLPSPNVELAETVNNLPSSHHLNRKGKRAAVTKLLSSPDSSIIATCGTTGEVNIWNAELTLFKLKTVDLKEDFKNTTTSSLFGPKEAVLQQQQVVLGNLNEGELLSGKIFS